MESFPVIFLLTIGFCFAYVSADCGEDSAKKPDEGEVTHFFKNLGCKIQKGAENIQENTKPWTDKIGASAKEFGNTVAHKYDELKHKLTDDEKDEGAGPSTPFAVANAPTEKVPLAPLFGDSVPTGGNSNPSVVAPIAGVGKGEQTDETSVITPSSIDDRFLFQTHECPRGQALDHRRRCRPNA